MDSAPAAPEPSFLADVVAEHMDEAEFAHVMLEAALDSPLYSLDEVARGPEETLLAHVDGLAVGGGPVAEAALIPELEEPEEPSLSRGLAAALALLGQGREDVVDKALHSETPEVSAAAQRAIVLVGSARFEQTFAARLAAPTEVRYRRALLSTAAGRGLALESVLEWLQSPDPDEQLASAILVRRAPPERHLPATEALLDHPDTRVRDEALVTALMHGSSMAFRHCYFRASDEREPDAHAMVLLALLGSAAHHEVLLGHLARPTHLPGALFALGFTGQTAVVPALLATMTSKHPRAPRLAGEAFAGITGLDTTQSTYTREAPPEQDALPALEDDDLDADLVPGPEDDLPLPDATSIAAWWEENAGRLHTRHPLLAGEPWSIERVVAQLETAKMRRRHALAMWLAIRTGGAVQVDTRAFSATQRAQLATARGLTSEALVRSFS